MYSMDVKGIKLSYDRSGSGRPLVLLHGYPLDRSIWQDVAKSLEPSFDILMPDLRGFGESAISPSDYSLADLAGDIAALLDGLNIRKAAIAGHSMGGYVALAFAHAHSDKLVGLGLVATQAAADPPDRQEVRYATARRVAEEGVGFVAESMPEKLSVDAGVQAFCANLIRRQPPAALMGALKAMAKRDDSVSRLASIGVPVTIVHGTADALIPVERAREMRTALPHAHYRELAGGGHMPMMEDPTATAEALRLLA